MLCADFFGQSVRGLPKLGRPTVSQFNITNHAGIVHPAVPAYFLTWGGIIQPTLCRAACCLL